MLTFDLASILMTSIWSKSFSLMLFYRHVIASFLIKCFVCLQADKLTTILKAAGVSVEPYWPSEFSCDTEFTGGRQEPKGGFWAANPSPPPPNSFSQSEEFEQKA